MKSLKAIQVLAKIGKILSKIIFICCIVGFCGCIVGIVSLALGFESVKFGGVTFKSIIENKADLTVPMLCASIGIGCVWCIAEAILSKFAEIYFRNELTDGTPFTMRGAKELTRLGILAVAIPLAAAIVCGIGVGAASHFYPELEKLNHGGGTSIGIGVMMIVTSLFCRYGAELRGEKPEEASDAE